VIVFRSCGAFTEHRVDVWYSRCHSQAQPSRNPYPPDLLIVVYQLVLPRVIRTMLTYESKDFCFSQPVKVRWASAREYL